MAPAVELGSRVRALYELGWSDPVAPIGVGELARRLLGPNFVRFVGNPLVNAHGVCVLFCERWQLQVYRDVPPVELTMALARGLARWSLFRYPPVRPVRFETFAEHIALPEQALLAQGRLAGMTAKQIADDMVVPLAMVERRMRGALKRTGPLEVPPPCSAVSLARTTPRAARSHWLRLVV